MSERSRRQHPRVSGPFQGVRLGLLSTNVYIHDLSVGGCLIESHHEEPVGSSVRLEIDLPYGAPLIVEGEILYLRRDYGFAVRFVNLSDQQKERLVGVIGRLAELQDTSGS